MDWLCLSCDRSDLLQCHRYCLKSFKETLLQVIYTNITMHIRKTNYYVISKSPNNQLTIWSGFGQTKMFTQWQDSREDVTHMAHLTLCLTVTILVLQRKNLYIHFFENCQHNIEIKNTLWIVFKWYSTWYNDTTRLPKASKKTPRSCYVIISDVTKEIFRLSLCFSEFCSKTFYSYVLIVQSSA